MPAINALRGVFQAMHGKDLKNLSKFLPADLRVSLHRALGQAARLYPAWSAVVPGDLASTSRPTGYANGVLTVQVDSPVWASVLRQQQRTLVDRLRQTDGLGELQEIRLKVVPGSQPVGPNASPRRPASRITDEATASIARTAETVADNELKAALKRLQETAARRNNKQD